MVWGGGDLGETGVKAQNVPEGLNCSPMSNTPFICMDYCDGGDLRQVRVCVCVCVCVGGGGGGGPGLAMI